MAKMCSLKNDVEKNQMRVLVTGSKGFIGKHLVLRLSELKDYEIVEFARGQSLELLTDLVCKVDIIVHLAGENRPANVKDFALVNTDLTQAVCDAVRSSGRNIPLILTSSEQAGRDNPYGKSKLEAEHAVEKLVMETGNASVTYRLPGVFGKWCRPNYNSVVATFCYNIANEVPIHINDAEARIRLVYVDDVISDFITTLNNMENGGCYRVVAPEFLVTVGELADQIYRFKNCRTSLLSERVGTGLIRALYATYVSYLHTDKSSYYLPQYRDKRGMFVEVLKTPDTGQFSYFTAYPGVTRGGHYHHTKTEKFLVIKGKARFGFRHIITDETYELFISGDVPQVVDTIPGWAHDITNVGDEEMVVMIWANEIFNRELPDTIASKVWK